MSRTPQKLRRCRRWIASKSESLHDLQLSLSPDTAWVLYVHVPKASTSLLHRVGAPDSAPYSAPYVARLSDGIAAEFKARGQRARFAADGHSIIYVDTNSEVIVRREFPSPASAPVTALVPASPDIVIETFHIRLDGRRVVVS